MTSSPPLPEALSQARAFAPLTDLERGLVSDRVRPVKLTAGETLFEQGTPAHTCWLLGPEVQVLSVSSDGPGTRSVPLARLGAGELVGEMALVDQGLRSTSAVVLQGGTAYALDGADFLRWREEGNPLAFKILRELTLELCARLRGTSGRIEPYSTPHVPPAAPKGTPIPEGRPAPSELDHFDGLRSLPAVVKVALADKLRVVKHSMAAKLFSEGDLGDSAYFLIEGEVVVSRHGRTLARLHANEMFGMVSVLDGGLRSADCSTTGPARLWRLSAPDFELLFAAGNRFALQIVDVVARQLVAQLRAANLLLERSRPAHIPGTPRPELPALAAEADVFPRKLAT